MTSRHLKSKTEVVNKRCKLYIVIVTDAESQNEMMDYLRYER